MDRDEWSKEERARYASTFAALLTAVSVGVARGKAKALLHAQLCARKYQASGVPQAAGASGGDSDADVSDAEDEL
jgi:hypothetical protein